MSVPNSPGNQRYPVFRYSQRASMEVIQKHVNEFISWTRAQMRNMSSQERQQLRMDHQQRLQREWQDNGIFDGSNSSDPNPVVGDIVTRLHQMDFEDDGRFNHSPIDGPNPYQF